MIKHGRGVRGDIWSFCRYDTAERVKEQYNRACLTYKLNVFDFRFYGQVNDGHRLLWVIWPDLDIELRFKSDTIIDPYHQESPT